MASTGTCGSESPQQVMESIVNLFAQHGDSNYGKEAVTQREHALQAAHFARSFNAPESVVVAALLHDVGHLLHDLPEDAPDHGVDDMHETLAFQWMEPRFIEAVTQPACLHVQAKRYLAAAEPGYFAQLSAPSVQSLALQGGPMSAEEVTEFEKHPFFKEATLLRRCDEAAKVPKLQVAPLAEYLPAIERCLKPQAC
ncbi:metal-dependent phosphohydrolase [Planctopirus hydrillae]|uniref:Metal-dependent phosphohydrolase n=2 Tax=Planctopirus hydrillae TaxID=1841610 RepID=A0A1C3E8I4_9PLAN|nr:metal-dependent phosphohydrolase [Planctopirus hydrillae]